MKDEPTYKQGFKDIARGLWTIMQLLPVTFGRQTKKLVFNHPIYLLFFVGTICAQVYTLANERVARDAESKTIYELQHKIDSLNGKQVKYYSYRQ